MVSKNGLTSDEFESILYYKKYFFQTKVGRVRSIASKAALLSGKGGAGDFRQED